MRSRSSAEAVGLEAVGLEAVRLEAVGVGAVGVGAIWVEWRAESGAVAGRALVGKVHVGGREGKARAFDALKLEAEPLLVHGAALLQLGELLLVLQVVLLEGCAQATHTTRSARARRSNGHGGWAGPSPEHAPRSRSWRSSRCCSSWRLSCCSSGGSVACIAVSRCSSRRSSSIRCESSFARWLNVSSAPWIAESSS